MEVANEHARQGRRHHRLQRRHRPRDGGGGGRAGSDDGPRLPQPEPRPRRRPRRSPQRTWNDDVHVVPLDLADLASVRKAADDILSRWDRLDVLVNNAGGTWSATPADGAGLRVHVRRQPPRPLLPDQPAAASAARRARPPRVVNLTSVGHHAARGGMRFDDLQSERVTRPWRPTAARSWPTCCSPVSWPSGWRATAVDGATPSTRAGCAAASAWTATYGRHRASACSWSGPSRSARRRGAKTSVYLATSPDGRRARPACTGCGRKPGHMSRQRPRRRGGGAAVGRERAAPGVGRVRRSA